MIKYAMKGIFHDRIRSMVTVVGIVFAVILVSIQLAIFCGVQASTSNVIDHSRADLWITSKGARHILAGTPISKRKLYDAIETPGVTAAARYIVSAASWRRSDGAEEDIQVIGLDLDRDLGGPWNLIEGGLTRLKEPGAVIVDRLYLKKLGIHGIGESGEIHGHRARVVGLTTGLRTFTTAPVVFTSLNSAYRYTGVSTQKTTFVLVKANLADLRLTRDRLAARLRDADVITTAEFSNRTRRYWMITTGAGAIVLGGAALALVVGTALVSQTVYAATLEHIAEFGMLKAMGARNGYLTRVLLTQASATGVIGYLVGIALVSAFLQLMKSGPVEMCLSTAGAVTVLFLTLTMCCTASLSAVRAVMKLDPATICRR